MSDYHEPSNELSQKARTDIFALNSFKEEIEAVEKQAAKKNFKKSIPIGRYATNNEIATLAVFLASDESSFITGTVNPIDEGMTI